MLTSLSRKDLKDRTWTKPETPEVFRVMLLMLIDVFKSIKVKTFQKRDIIQDLKKRRKENKIMSYAFKTIDRETRIVRI